MSYARILLLGSSILLFTACSDSSNENTDQIAQDGEPTDIATPIGNDVSPTEITPAPTEDVITPPDDVVSRLSLDTDFYKQYLDADGIPIVASDSVSPYALLEARWTISKMLVNRPDVVSAIASTRTRVAIMATDEFTTDIPEHATLTPADFWDRRARGLGATYTRPAVSAGEENILQLPGDPYISESIMVHEFAHTLFSQGLYNLDSSIQKTIDSIYSQAMEEGLWAGTYAATNSSEYFAEGVHSWFDTNRANDSQHNNISARAELINYDIRLAELLEQIFGDNQWAYKGPTERDYEREHLSGYDPATAGVFSWPEVLSSDSPLPLKNVLLEDWSNASSPQTSTASKIEFTNETSDTVSVQWVNFDGQRINNFGEGIAPQASLVLNTFDGHLFEVLAADGRSVIARFRANSTEGLAVIE